MNIKIQGGGSGTYANTGSCTGVTVLFKHFYLFVLAS